MSGLRSRPLLHPHREQQRGSPTRSRAGRRSHRSGGCSSPGRVTRCMGPWQRHSEAGPAARAEAVVARSVPARLDVGLATARQVCWAADSEQAQSRVACARAVPRDRCDLDHTVVAWPGVAVISSLPAHALLPIVRRRSAVQQVAGPSTAAARCTELTIRSLASISTSWSTRRSQRRGSSTGLNWR